MNSVRSFDEAKRVEWTSEDARVPDTLAVLTRVWASFRPSEWWCRSKNWSREVFPCLDWILGYRWNDLPWDILAGVSVACMLVPQGMSYANLAGLPSVYGLYGAFVPALVYGLLGTSRQLAVGPVAVTSLLLGTSLHDLFGHTNANPNKPTDPVLQEEINRAAIQIAFLVGVLYTAIGVLRLGWLTNFLSYAVMSGFMTGSALLIASSQVWLFFWSPLEPRPALVLLGQVHPGPEHPPCQHV